MKRSTRAAFRSRARRPKTVKARYSLVEAGPAPEGRRIVAHGEAVRRNRGWKVRLGMRWSGRHSLGRGAPPDSQSGPVMPASTAFLRGKTPQTATSFCLRAEWLLALGLPQILDARGGGFLQRRAPVDLHRGEPPVADFVQALQDRTEIDVAGPEQRSVAFAKMHVA